MLLLNKLIIDSGAINILNDKEVERYLEYKKRLLQFCKDKSYIPFQGIILMKHIKSNTVMSIYDYLYLINVEGYSQTEFRSLSDDERFSYLESDDIPQDIFPILTDIVLKFLQAPRTIREAQTSLKQEDNPEKIYLV